MRKTFVSIIAAFLVSSASIAQQILPYQDVTLTPEQRADDLIKRLTIEEKTQLMMDNSLPIERLSIPHFQWWNEALHGVGRNGFATVFPITMGMAASWDDALLYKCFDAVSDEARIKNVQAKRNNEMNRYQSLSFWTPNINIFRDPRWGRGQETYGEDPYLTSRMGLAVVNGLQGPKDSKYKKLLACAKHYAVHSGPEWNRHSFNIENLPERDLWETYLPAFKALVQEGDVAEVMCAYQRIDGDPCCGNTRYLQQILRDEWGFKGIVVSDCGAIRDFYQKGHHETHADAAEASAAAVKAGCDLECGSSYAALVEAVKRGLITEAEIDRSVERLMVAKLEMGLFEKEDPYNTPYSVVDCEKHRALAKQIALESFVLLQNRGNILPLDKAKKVAIVGPNADLESMQWGNYNGTPSYTITLKEGVESLLGADRVVFEQLCGHTDVSTYNTLFGACSYAGKPGFHATYWNNLDFEGTPAATDQITRPMNFSTGGNTVFAPGVNLSAFTARYEATFKPENTGRAVFRISSNETVRIFVNGKLLADKTNVKNTITVCEFEYELGTQYDIKIEYGGYRRRTDAFLNLDMAEAVPQDIPAFLERVKDIDVVIFAGGISPQLEGEEMAVSAPGFRGGDRDDIELPAIQRETMAALKKAGKQVVLVNFSGSAMALVPESENCDAILQAWYPGQEGGSALADVLYGNASPSGKLPLTFYRSVDQLPDFQDYNMKGKTYRYFEGDPLFCFGHGLTYTEFFYGKPKSDKRTLKEGQTLYVTVPVGNIGTREGTEIVQLYIDRPSDVEGPIQALRDYRRVTLAPGASEMVVFELTEEDFVWFNPATERMEPMVGEYEVRIGGTSDRTKQQVLRVKLR
jgi:beta-glucosidase